MNSLKDLGDDTIAAHSRRFFKTGKGEYGEGDRFLGVRVPVIRKQAKAFRKLPLSEAVKLLRSRYHEARLCALVILVDKFEHGSEPERQKIFQLYLENTDYVNGWDLVDSSAHKIVGPSLPATDHSLLHTLARSASLWERRIAIIATLHFIAQRQFDTTLRISEILLYDNEDLIHKAVGWMLREVGNRAPKVERGFLKKHYKTMPRTMLRYAIEKFPEEERKRYLAGTV